MKDEQGDAIRRILVGVDGSDGAARAVAWSARLARAAGAEVVAVHAIGTPIFLDGYPFGARVGTGRSVARGVEGMA
jgi:nucleotide-binding universal stress UspA family protein